MDTWFTNSSFTSIVIGGNITSIGRYAFYEYESLTSINIPEGVTSIGDYAFQRCSSLASITIPNSVTSIGSGAFSYCSSLASVTIGKGVTEIGEYAFSFCSSLVNIYCKPTTPPYGDTGMFTTSYAGERKIYVPRASVEAYKTANYWSDDKSYIYGYDF